MAYNNNNNKSFLLKESPDLFAEELLLSSTDTITNEPLQEESGQRISVYCENYIKDGTSDESFDSDPTPDLEFATTYKSDKNYTYEESNDSVKMKKTILNWNITQEDSDDSDPTLTPDLEVACNLEIARNILTVPFHTKLHVTYLNKKIKMITTIVPKIITLQH